jgi:16S rRNA (adenine1518-N6/adenine1519-N6)-dimethyltransferase
VSRVVAGHVARKRFGQNFLVDRSVIARILDVIDPRPEDNLVEIGPGLGALTEPLIEHAGSLKVIELDRDLATRLTQAYPRDKLDIYQADALSFDFAQLGTRLRVVGNLPYNISSPLLFRLCDCASAIRDIHVMLQREVVERIVASPATKAYGRLSVMLGYRFHAERLLRVPAGAFRPAPKVDSAFLRLTPHDPMPCRAVDEVLFGRVVAAAFGKRRKTLRNALREIASDALLEAASVDLHARAETLAVGQLVALANHIASASNARG